jgi:hypothetical protein
VLRLSTPRPLTERELGVLRATLERAERVALAPHVFEGLQSLRVIGGCECGCDSVDFAEHDSERPSRPIADGTGKTPAGGDVGIIIWGTDDAVTGIEVYDLGAGDEDIKLPVESSIRLW